MTANTHVDRARPMRSQSSHRANYDPKQRPGRVRQQAPNAFVAARMGYRAILP
jgi:hypothetical protein